MTLAQSSQPLRLSLPDHTQLPESDGTFVKNFQEHPQSIVLTESIRPVLQQLHPDGRYCIGQDSGIYWRLTDPPEKGSEAPDWFYVANVPATLNGIVRRSYVLWREIVAPTIAIEFVSGDGSEERDATSPLLLSEAFASEPSRKPGKFWVYEQAIRIPFYAIYEVEKASVEVYHLVDGRYQRMTSNERQHYPISAMGVELGIWQGQIWNLDLPWLRWWNDKGELLLTGEEQAEQERRSRQKAEQAKLQAEQAKLQAEQAKLQAEQERSLEQQARLEAERKAQRLAERLKALGIDPNDI
jgi:Uma2 family endonuclease